MLKSFADFLVCYRQWLCFKRQPPLFREIVFYSEGAWDWPHLWPIIRGLLLRGEVVVTCLTSDIHDPLLREKHPRLFTFYIGSGVIRTIAFLNLRAKIMITSLPDLQIYFLKKSLFSVHYVYVFHSIFSTHMVYRRQAFDFFDSILCVGPYQIAEIKEREKMEGLSSKKLFEVGYCKFDLMSQAEPSYSEKIGQSSRKENILLLPTWGDGSFLERDEGLRLVEELIGLEKKIYLRVHPMTVRRKPKLIYHLQQLEKRNKSFRLILNLDEKESFHECDYCISDWSSAAYEFALARERPILFFDTPKKVHNADYKKIGLQTFEEQYREWVGVVIPFGGGADLLNRCQELEGKLGQFKNKIIELKSKKIFNYGQAGEAAAQVILRLLKTDFH